MGGKRRYRAKHISCFLSIIRWRRFAQAMLERCDRAGGRLARAFSRRQVESGPRKETVVGRAAGKVRNVISKAVVMDQLHSRSW